MSGAKDMDSEQDRVSAYLGGAMTPTEAAAVSAVYALGVAVFIYRDLKIKDLPHVFLEAGRTTVMLMFIVANALLFAHVLTTERIPQTIADW